MRITQNFKICLVSILIFLHINTYTDIQLKTEAVSHCCAKGAQAGTSKRNSKMLKCLQQEEEEHEKGYLVCEISENHDALWSFPWFERVRSDNKQCHGTHKPTLIQPLALQGNLLPFLLV